jgi:hypothetical protein
MNNEIYWMDMSANIGVIVLGIAMIIWKIKNQKRIKILEDNMEILIWKDIQTMKKGIEQNIADIERTTRPNEHD